MNPKLTLTAEQVATLKAIAQKHGMGLLITRNQIGIGYSGNPAKNVVYTHGVRKPWQLRHESYRPLKEEMKAVVG